MNCFLAPTTIYPNQLAFNLLFFPSCPRHASRKPHVRRNAEGYQILKHAVLRGRYSNTTPGHSMPPATIVLPMHVKIQRLRSPLDAVRLWGNGIVRYIPNVWFASAPEALEHCAFWVLLSFFSTSTETLRLRHSSGTSWHWKSCNWRQASPHEDGSKTVSNGFGMLEDVGIFYYVSICFYMFLYVSICFYMFLYVSICFYMFLYVSICFYVSSGTTLWHSSVHSQRCDKWETTCGRQLGVVGAKWKTASGGCWEKTSGKPHLEDKWRHLRDNWETRFQGSRDPAPCKQSWETRRKTKCSGRHSGRQSERQGGRQVGDMGDKVPRFPEPCAYMPKEGGTRYHRLLLEIETQQFSAAGNYFTDLGNASSKTLVAACRFSLQRHDLLHGWIITNSQSRAAQRHFMAYN